MNAYPVCLAAGLALAALGALAEESPDAKTAKPAVTQEIPPYEVGLNDQPVQLPTQFVDGLRDHVDHVNRDLRLALQREEMAGPHALYQKTLPGKTLVEAFLPLEQGSHHAVALPVLRSSW